MLSEINNNNIAFDIQLVLSLVAIVFSLFSLLLNFIGLIITFYVNFYGFEKRKQNERLYQQNLTYYEKLVIPEFNSLIEFAFDSENIVEKHVHEILSLRDGTNVRGLIEENINYLDEKNRIVIRNSLTKIYCYSKPCKNELEKIITTFYDSSTILLSKMNSNTLTPLDIKRIRNDFFYNKTIYLRETINTVRKYTPTVE